MSSARPSGGMPLSELFRVWLEAEAQDEAGLREALGIADGLVRLGAEPVSQEPIAEEFAFLGARYGIEPVKLARVVRRALAVEAMRAGSPPLALFTHTREKE